VTPAAITKACRAQLAAALVGTRIDIDHHAARDYLRVHGVHDPRPADHQPPPRPAPPAAANGGNGSPPQSASERPPVAMASSPSAPAPAGSVRGPTSAELCHVQVPADVEPFRHWTLEHLIDEFGTSRRFLDWLDALKRIEEVRAKRIANEEREGSLIPRDPVRTHIFGIIDSTFRRLLTDAPKTTARRLFALANSGATVEEAEIEVRQINSSLIKAIKATARRRLGDD
jgi:hypothetical protein